MISRTHNPSIGELEHRGVTTRLPISTIGWALSSFLTISFVLCVVGYLVFPQLPIAHSALSIFLPGFTLLNWRNFFLGLVESFAWGWYIAIGFGLLYNFFASTKASAEA